MINQLLGKVFGTKNERVIKALMPNVKAINALEPQIEKLTDAELRAKTDEFAHNFYYRDSDFKIVDYVSEIARKRGVNNAQVALAWMLSKPEVTAPIVGASKMQHLDDALKALELHLDDDEIKALEEPYEPHPILGHT